MIVVVTPQPEGRSRGQRRQPHASNRPAVPLGGLRAWFPLRRARWRTG